jgi:hypothetical protein
MAHTANKIQRRAENQVSFSPHDNARPALQPHSHWPQMVASLLYIEVKTAEALQHSLLFLAYYGNSHYTLYNTHSTVHALCMRSTHIRSCWTGLQAVQKCHRQRDRCWVHNHRRCTSGGLLQRCHAFLCSCHSCTVQHKLLLLKTAASPTLFRSAAQQGISMRMCPGGSRSL